MKSNHYYYVPGFFLKDYKEATTRMATACILKQWVKRKQVLEETPRHSSVNFCALVAILDAIEHRRHSHK